MWGDQAPQLGSHLGISVGHQHLHGIVLPQIHLIAINKMLFPGFPPVGKVAGVGVSGHPTHSSLAGHERIEEHDPVDAFTTAIRHTGDRDTREGVTYQNEVAQILKLKDPSPMIIGDKGGENSQFLVSTAADKPEILIWQLRVTPQS